jgi:hypothetical protein
VCVPFRDRRGRWYLPQLACQCIADRYLRHTNIDMRLVSCEGGIVPDAVHPPARALRTQSILHWVDTAVVLQGTARSAQEDSGEGRHGVGPD